MMIDSHQHFWRLSDRAGYWPPAELTAIYRDFFPEDLEPTLRRNGVRGTVLVQTLPSIVDTEFMLDLAARNPFILGVVGWVDLASADAPASIGRLAANPRLKGLRPMLQDLADDRWIENPALAPAVRAMIEHRLCFDALVLPRHLESLLVFARRFPELPIVIDHAAKPLIADGLTEPWLTDMLRLAELPQVCCKMSGMLTEAGPNPSLEAVRPYAETILKLFGPSRLLWGSDWPVLRLAGDYDSWLAMSRSIVAHLPPEEQSAIFGGNAIRVYRLQESLKEVRV